jgi:fatty acid omega-hydroxylase
MKYGLRMEVRPRDLAPVVDELRGAGVYDAAARATAASCA